MSAALRQLDIAARPLSDYTPACGTEAIERVQSAAQAVAGMRVLHISGADAGGAVPGFLRALLPLAADAGVAVQWRVFVGGPGPDEVARALRDGFGGATAPISDAAWQAYLDACITAIDSTGGGFDAVVLHDPETLGLVRALQGGPVIWRCHIDASRPDRQVWERAGEPVAAASALVVGDSSLAPPGAEAARECAPGLDPLSARNLELEPRLAGRMLRELGLDLDRPLVTLAASAAAEEISDHAEGEEGLQLFTGHSGLGDVEIGALNQISRAAVCASLREASGLAAAEALWRGTPVVGDQAVAPVVRDGVDGYLAGDPQESATRIIQLVRDPGLAIEMGRAGRERVRERFLITRALEDELKLLAATV